MLLVVCQVSISQTVLLDDPFATGTTSGTSAVGNVPWMAESPNDCDGNIGTFEASGGTFIISDVEGSGCCSCAGGGDSDCGDNNTTIEVGPVNGSGFYIEIPPDFISISANGPLEPPTTIPCSNFTCGDTTPGCGDMPGPPNMNTFGQDQLIVVVNGIPIRAFCGSAEPCPDPTLCFLNEDIEIEIIGGTQSNDEDYEISNITIEGYPYVEQDVQACSTASDGSTNCDSGELTVCDGDDVNFNTVADIFTNAIPSSASFEWSLNGSNISSSGSSAEIMINGASSSDAGTYSLSVVFTGPNNAASCELGPFEVDLVVENEIDAGSDASTNVENCASSTLDFTSEIGGDHPGGIWSDDDGAGVSINAGNSVSFDGVSTGTYDFTYEVQGCNPGTAVLSVTVDDCNPCDPDVDMDGDTICSSDDCDDNDDQIGMVGDDCDDGDATTDNDIVQNDCTCAGTSIFDCPNLVDDNGDTNFNVGDPCDDGIDATDNDEVQPGCVCQGEDCNGAPGGSALPGTPCPDEPGFIDSEWDNSCNCVGTPDVDCPDLIDDNGDQGFDIGDDCDDGDSDTGDDVVQADCTCEGLPLDCEGVAGGSDTEGEDCDDGDDGTVNDVYQNDCSCEGTPCPTGLSVIAMDMEYCAGDDVELDITITGGDTDVQINVVDADGLIDVMLDGDGNQEVMSPDPTSCVPLELELILTLDCNEDVEASVIVTIYPTSLNVIQIPPPGTFPAICTTGVTVPSECSGIIEVSDGDGNVLSDGTQIGDPNDSGSHIYNFQYTATSLDCLSPVSIPFDNCNCVDDGSCPDDGDCTNGIEFFNATTCDCDVTPTVAGCTDPTSPDFDAAADCDDGSCSCDAQDCNDGDCDTVGEWDPVACQCDFLSVDPGISEPFADGPDGFLICTGESIALTPGITGDMSLVTFEWVGDNGFGIVSDPDNVVLTNSDCIPLEITFTLTAFCIETGDEIPSTQDVTTEVVVVSDNYDAFLTTGGDDTCDTFVDVASSCGVFISITPSDNQSAMEGDGTGTHTYEVDFNVNGILPDCLLNYPDITVPFDCPTGACPEPSPSPCNTDCTMGDLEVWDSTICDCVLDEPIVNGCTDVTACNFDSAANCDDGNCESDDSGTCNVDCLMGDLEVWDPVDCMCVLDEVVIQGCTDVNASNYDVLANCDDGSCSSDCPDPGDCNSDCTIGNIEVWDTDLCDCVDDVVTALGCTDNTACNFEPMANCDDGSCISSTDPGTCNTDCQNGDLQVWNSTTCACELDEVVVFGCTNMTANNFEPAANCDDNSCTFDCPDDGTCNDDCTLGDLEVWNGTSCSCEVESTPVLGCTDNTACNFDPAADCDDGSCQANFDPGACNTDCMLGDLEVWDNVSCSCVLDVVSVLGCTNTTANNFDPSATCDDASCVFDCPDDGSCNQDCTMGDLTIWDGDVCACVLDEVSIPGCMDPNACNFDPAANCDNSSCIPNTDPGTCNSDCNLGDIEVWNPVTCNCDVAEATVFGCTNNTANNFDPTANCDDDTCTFDCPDDGTCNTDCLMGDLEEWDGNICACATSSLSTPGCTDPAATNFEASANCDDGSCDFDCADDGSCNSDCLTGDLEIWNPVSCSCTVDIVVVPGCDDPAFDNFNPLANCDDGSCANDMGCPDLDICDDNDCSNGEEIWNDTICACETINIPEPFNCIDDMDCTNGIEFYDPADCQCKTDPSIAGCTNPTASNFDPLANCDDGSCGGMGCSDDGTCDDGDCSNGVELFNFTSCMCDPGTPPDSSTCVDDGDCSNGFESWNAATCSCDVIPPVLGCTDVTDPNFDPMANCVDNTACADCASAPMPCDDGDCSNGIEVWSAVDCGCITGPATVVEGCTDINADNFNPAANCDDASCQFACPDPGVCDDFDCTNGIESWNFSTCACETSPSTEGCTNPVALNFDSLADCDDGSCTFPEIAELVLPTAFSPNNDTVNDRFYLMGNDFTTCEMRVFNRWGEEVFSAIDCASGWDGLCPNGEECAIGVYVFYMNVELLDGTSTVFRGNVTLIR